MRVDQRGGRAWHAAAEPDDGLDPPVVARRHMLRRMLLGFGALVTVLVVAVAGAFWLVVDRYAGHVDRIDDVFPSVNDRPAPATSSAGVPVTFLLVGSDTRGHPASGTDPDGRSDAIMVVRLSGDRLHAQAVSIPRDSWVPIPGHGTSKINASYAWGGPALLIQTVEQLTGVRIDHYVAIDFDGIAQVTDALGGVDVQVATTSKNGPYTFPAGVNHITAEKARWYLGERKDLPGGDFDRMKRQQQYLRAVFTKLFSMGTFTNVDKLDSALRLLSGAVSIDDTVSNADLVRLGYSMRGLTSDNMLFFTAPILGTGREGAASVVYLDQVAGARMWGYLRSDSLAGNAAEFRRQSLPDVPN